MDILLCERLDDAVVAYIVNKWSQTSKEPLGRIIIQKVCYFLKSKGIPLDYSFDMYHYGPYSQDLHFRMDDLVADGIVNDKSTKAAKSNYMPGKNNSQMINMFSEELTDIKESIDSVIDMLSEFDTSTLELLSTVHYFQTSYTNFYGREPHKDYVMGKVKEAKKEKFSDVVISAAYDALKKAGLFEWKSAA